MRVANVEASPVGAESSGEEATKDKFEQAITLVIKYLYSFHITA